MVVVFRWMIRIVSGLLVLAVLATAMVYYLAAQSLPDYDTTRETPGISAPVEIVRNNANIPHIFGQGDSDVFFGLGYAHAQDRLWQMMMLRRTAQGRLSEVFGMRTFKTDELMRRLDLYRLAQADVAEQDRDTQKALSAYASGVNAYLSRINSDALGRGAPEFFLFPGGVSPWQPADSLAVLKLMALQQSGHLQDEVLRARISLTLPEERLRDILPDMPGTGVAALPDYAALFEDAPEFASRPSTAQPPALWPVPARGQEGASNAWAAAPDRSAAGASLMANDPHLSFTAPSLWYLARLELSTGGVIGGTIPGMPLMLVGRSKDFAWGVTSSYLDDQDLFIEELNPDNADQLRTEDGYKALEIRSTIVKIKDQAPVTITLQWSENGPVLPGTMFDLASVTPPGHVAALSWTALEPRDRSMSAGIQLMRAGNVNEGISAGADFVAPSMNLTMIDKTQIAMKVIGAMPRRHRNMQTKGRMPSLGWRADNRWDGIETYSANPEFVQPKGGSSATPTTKWWNAPSRCI